MGAMTKKATKQADAAIGHDRAAENDGENGPLGPSFLVM